MIDIRDIHPLTDFQRNAKKYVRKINETRQPVVLTVNGKPALVLRDAKSYQQLLIRLEELETLKAILQANKEFEEGKGIPWEQAETDLRKKLGIQDRALAKSRLRANSGARVGGDKLVAHRRRRVV